MSLGTSTNKLHQDIKTSIISANLNAGDFNNKAMFRCSHGRTVCINWVWRCLESTLTTYPKKKAPRERAKIKMHIESKDSISEKT